MVKIDSYIEAEPISKRERFNVCREFFRPRHLGVAHKDWNNRKLSLQCVCDLETHKVTGLVNSTPSMFAFSRPVRSNYRHQNLGLPDYLFDVIAKIDAVRNRVEVHEYIIPTECRLEPVIKAAGNRQRIFPAVRNRDHELGVWRF